MRRSRSSLGARIALRRGGAGGARRRGLDRRRRRLPGRRWSIVAAADGGAAAALPPPPPPCAARRCRCSPDHVLAVSGRPSARPRQPRFGVSPERVTLAPSRRRSAPSVTTSIAGREPRLDGEEIPVLRAQLDRMHRHRVLGVDQIHVAAGRAALHGPRRHPDDILERVQEHHHVDELAREEPLVGVVEVRRAASLCRWCCSPEYRPPPIARRRAAPRWRDRKP